MDPVGCRAFFAANFGNASVVQRDATGSDLGRSAATGATHSTSTPSRYATTSRLVTVLGPRSTPPSRADSRPTRPSDFPGSETLDDVQASSNIGPGVDIEAVRTRRSTAAQRYGFLARNGWEHPGGHDSLSCCHVFPAVITVSGRRVRRSTVARTRLRQAMPDGLGSALVLDRELTQWHQIGRRCRPCRLVAAVVDCGAGAAAGSSGGRQ